MLKCAIKVGDNIFETIEDFAKYVKENGISSLKTSDNELANKILFKYDPTLAEDSLMEMWAKLEWRRRNPGKELQGYLSEQQINDLIYPQGQLTDYSTQEQIRANTFSGKALTGISANTGKTLGYTFAAEPIESIRRKSDGMVVFADAQTKEFKELLKENRVENAERLIAKNPDWEVRSRKPVMIKPEHHLNINGVVLDRLSREELELKNGSSKVKMLKGIAVNIFETIDTIINLAIDNVKEQKLFVLGITNSNANTFLSMLAYGVPFQDVSRIFKTPVMHKLSENKRITQDTVDEAMQGAVENLIQQMEESPSEMAEAFRKYAGGTKVFDQVKAASSPREVVSIMSKISLQTDFLDDVYEGTAPFIKAVSDVVVLSTLSKLVPVGEQLFKYSQILSLLRSLPNKKFKMDSLWDTINDLNWFDTEYTDAKKFNKDAKEDLKQIFRENDATYKQMLDSSEATAEAYLKKKFAKAEENSDLLYAELDEATRANFLNRLLRRSISRDITASSNSVFQTNALLNLPHVFSAYRSLGQLRNVIEQAFTVHSPAVKDFCFKLLKEANIFTSYSPYEKTETVQREFVKFVASNLELDHPDLVGTDGSPLFIGVDENETPFSTTFSTVYGEEAWIQKFIQQFTKAQESIEGNAFMDHVEIKIEEATGLKKILITADKSSDDEVLESMRQDFAELAKDPEYRDLARNLFKYALMSSGMYYNRTSLSLIFPDSWAGNFASKMDQRLDNVLSPSSVLKSKLNLSLLKDVFLFQLLRNNASLIGYTSNVTFNKTGFFINAKGKKVLMYSGTDEWEGGKVHYDLSMRVPYSEESSRKFIRRYGDEVYALLRTPGTDNTYYRLLTENINHKFYSFKEEDLVTSFDLDKLLDPSKRMVSRSSIRLQGSSATLVVPSDEANFEDGDMIYTYDKSGVYPKELVAYRVKGVGTPTMMGKVTGTGFRIEFVGKESLSKATWVDSVKEQVGAFLKTGTGSTTMTSSIESAIKKARANKYANVKALVRTSQSTDPSVATLDIIPINEDSTDKEIADYTETVLKQISKLDNNTNYYVSLDILDPIIDEFRDVARRFAVALANKIGFRHPIIDAPVEELSVLAVKIKDRLKYKDVIKLTIPSSIEISPSKSTEFTDTISFEQQSITKGIIRKMRAGDILDLGTINNTQTYAYVESVPKEGDAVQEAKITRFGAPLYDLLTTNNYSKEKFEELKEKSNKC